MSIKSFITAMDQVKMTIKEHDDDILSLFRSAARRETELEDITERLDGKIFFADNVSIQGRVTVL